MAELSPPPVSIELAQPATRLIVRADVQAAARAGMALGVLFGAAPCRAVITRQRTALWLGPDEWLVLAPEHEELRPDSLRGVTASIVDVSHAFAGIVVAGPFAALCINAFNALDLDARVFPPGTCTRTLFGKVQIILWRSDADAFRIEVTRSFAPYVWECLMLAAQEFLTAAP